MGARIVEPPILKPPRKNQKSAELSKRIGQPESARRDLSESAIKKFSTIFDLTTAPPPLEKYP